MPSTRTKTLLFDIVAFMMSGASIKLLSFFMVPLYTFYLSTEDYAVSDLVTLSIQLAIPLLTLSISDSVLRFGLESDSDKQSVLGMGITVTLFGSLASMPICVVVGMTANDWWLALFCFLLFSVQNLNNYFSAFLSVIET